MLSIYRNLEQTAPPCGKYETRRVFFLFFYSLVLLSSEILGAFISVMSIWIVTGVLVYLAIERIVRDDYEIDGHVMLVTSGCAVIVNIM